MEPHANHDLDAALYSLATTEGMRRSNRVTIASADEMYRAFASQVGDHVSLPRFAGVIVQTEDARHHATLMDRLAARQRRMMLANGIAPGDITPRRVEEWARAHFPPGYLGNIWVGPWNEELDVPQWFIDGNEPPSAHYGENRQAHGAITPWTSPRARGVRSSACAHWTGSEEPWLLT